MDNEKIIKEEMMDEMLNDIGYPRELPTERSLSLSEICDKLIRKGWRKHGQ